jgi:hypothetical protein
MTSITPHLAAQIAEAIKAIPKNSRRVPTLKNPEEHERPGFN